jgi:hypothetical protein
MKTLTIPVNEILKSCDTGTLDPHGYKFYEWLSSQFEGSIIVEAGTLKGRSARSFSRGSPSNLVISYDITDRPWMKNILTYDNIITKILDINKVDPTWFSKVDIIYLDISHNGTDEEMFLERIEPHFKGILIMDDINDKDVYPGLYNMFEAVTKEKHILPDSIGAVRGTGVIPYGDWTVEINDE